MPNRHKIILSRDLTVTPGATVAGSNTGDNAANSLYASLVSNATHTGDVTGSTALTIAAKAVTLAKMDDMATASLIYRKSAGAGAPEVNSLATLKTDLGLSGTNTGDQLLTFIGDATSNNYYKIAEWTLTGAYGTFASHISVMTTSKAFLAELYILCALDSLGTSFADPTFKLKDVFGTIGTSYFWLAVDNTSKKATLYFKNSTDYEPHYIQRIDTILNATTVVLSNTDIGSASNPTGTYAKTAAVT
jgi:hypothetical protein